MRFQNLVVLLLLPTVLAATACKKSNQEKKEIKVEGTYFSVRQFMSDQFATFRNQPFVFLKVVTDGTQTDSSYVAADTMAWLPVVEAFANADIGDSALVGSYKYSEFDETVTGQHMFLYEAADPELMTRQLMIGADPFTRKISSIYMDVYLPHGKTQKLYYAPLKMIQIQTFSGKGSKARNLRIEYRFPQNDQEAADAYYP